MRPRKLASVFVRALIMRRFLWKWVAVSVREENQKLAHLFMICSIIKLTATEEFNRNWRCRRFGREIKEIQGCARSIELLRFTRN